MTEIEINLAKEIMCDKDFVKKLDFLVYELTAQANTPYVKNKVYLTEKGFFGTTVTLIKKQ